MPALVAGIHAFARWRPKAAEKKAWMVGTSPTMRFM
jgi:hypothetical protein